MNLINGECLEEMKKMDSDSIDTIITDAPYGLKFMGKKWDYDVPKKEVWEECLRVLKPGGTALIFAGSRTQHRMAVNVEDAGFILKDTIMWLYGCLSEDSEILTKNGWKNINTITGKSQIFCYNVDTNNFEYNLSTKIHKYENKHTAYRIQSDYTDQIVSKNHRVAIEQDGKIIFKLAEHLGKKENIPFLESVGELQKTLKVLFSSMQLNNKMKRISKTFSQMKKLMEGKIKKEFQLKNELICDGTQIKSCDGNMKTFNKDGVCPSYKSQCGRQQNGKSDVIQNKLRTQELGELKKYKTTLANIKEIDYKGKVWCVEVPTGCFVARRKGKIFITGNSGFPKATDTSKQLMKKLGDKGIDTGEIDINCKGRSKRVGEFVGSECGQKNSRERNIINPTTPEAKLWNGWKSHGLKPAYEPIIVAVKPNEGTYANNALIWGVSGLNIDGGRIEIDKDDTSGFSGSKTINKSDSVVNSFGVDKFKKVDRSPHPQGRYPANIILDEKAGELLDEQSGILKTGGAKQPINLGGGLIKERKSSKGGASRFFYCAKASKSERNKGCEGLEEKEKAGSYQFRVDGSLDGKPTQPKSNHHPTVKPIKLMEYLSTLTKTPTGGIVLDPFMGSGTTGIACKNTGRDFIGIELDEEYFEIAKNRINNT